MGLLSSPCSESQHQHRNIPVCAASYWIYSSVFIVLWWLDSFSMCEVIASANVCDGTSAFPMWTSSFSFLFLVILLRLPELLRTNSKSEHLFLWWNLNVFSCRLFKYRQILWGFFSMHLICWEFYYERLLNIIKHSNSLKWTCGFMNHWCQRSCGWFVYVEPSLHFWCKCHLIVVFKLVDMLFNPVCQHFIVNSFIFVFHSPWE